GGEIEEPPVEMPSLVRNLQLGECIRQRRRPGVVFMNDIDFQHDFTFFQRLLSAITQDLSDNSALELGKSRKMRRFITVNLCYIHHTSEVRHPRPSSAASPLTFSFPIAGTIGSAGKGLRAHFRSGDAPILRPAPGISGSVEWFDAAKARRSVSLSRCVKERRFPPALRPLERARHAFPSIASLQHLRSCTGSAITPYCSVPTCPTPRGR